MMSAQEIWDWLVIPALAALALALIGIVGRHMISSGGKARYPILQFGVAVVIVAVAGLVVLGGQATITRL
jgi:hypothetical protein